MECTELPLEEIILELEVELNNTKGKDKPYLLTWTNREGKLKRLDKLELGHLKNLIPWLEKADRPKAKRIVEGELLRRYTGVYPEWFEDELFEYKLSPDTWRLKA